MHARSYIAAYIGREMGLNWPRLGAFPLPYLMPYTLQNRHLQQVSSHRGVYHFHMQLSHGGLIDVPSSRLRSQEVDQGVSLKAELPDHLSLVIIITVIISYVLHGCPYTSFHALSRCRFADSCILAWVLLHTGANAAFRCLLTNIYFISWCVNHCHAVFAWILSISIHYPSMNCIRWLLLTW